VTAPDSYRRQLDTCPRGHAGWKMFEDLCIEILTFLFVPPLEPPKVQARSLSGTDRRDAIFPNRTEPRRGLWGQLLDELGARLVLFEFKNYETDEIGVEEVLRTRSYLRKPMGRLAIIIGTKLPHDSAHRKRNTLFGEDGTVILFLTTEQLKEMLYMKERGDDPAGLIMDAVEEFYIQHE